MSTKYPGGIISKTVPTVVPPTNGEGGSASGVWTMDQAEYYIANGTWPLPIKQGGLWGWGRNDSGSIGLGNRTAYSSPKQVGSLVTWRNIATAFNNFTLAVKSDGTLWSWGSNSNGQLGLNNRTAYSSPKQVGALTNWLKVSCGYTNSFAIKTDGTLWSWGDPISGQLGQGNLTYYSSPKQVGSLTNWASLGGSGNGGHMAAIKTDGTLWVWGSGQSGGLGLGNTTSYSSPKQVGSLTNWASCVVSASGLNQYTLAIKTDGTLWSWGENSSGQLGLGNTTSYSSPKQVGALTSWGTISSANAFSASVKTNGTLWIWGNNSIGQLGNGSRITTYSPNQIGSLSTWLTVSAGYSYTSAIKTDGTLWSWGNGANGQLGLNNRTSYSSPKQVGSLTTWLKVSGGKYSTIAIAN